jgi:hypothetical protein
MTTHLAADLAVTLAENRPGALAMTISTIAEAGINIDGSAEMSGVVHVLTTELAAARQRLAEAHINVRYSYMATGNRLVIASGNAQAVPDALGER